MDFLENVTTQLEKIAEELIEKAKQMLCLEKQIDVEETITNFK